MDRTAAFGTTLGDDRMLAQRVVGDSHPMIYMNYGAGHLPGLLAQLQANDPAWNIVSLKWMRVIDDTDELTGNPD